MLADLDVEAFTHELLVKAAAMADRRWVLDAAGVGLVRADRHRVTEAVLNLVHNAVMHTESTGTIAVGSALADGRWRLWVRDDGVGAEPDLALFDASTRGAESRRRYQGSGLGLAIVKLVAEAHGGTPLLESAPGEGFVLTLDLPSRPAVAGAVHEESP